MKTTKHMSFNKAAASVAKKQHIPMKNAKAIIAAGARKASVSAKVANPRLLKVSGVKKGK